jgi:hypothetical protein
MQWGSRIVVCVLSVFASPLVSAALLTWSVSGGTFADGGTFAGTLVVDTASNTTPTWNLSVAGGGGSFPARSYTPANSTASTLLLLGNSVPSFLFHAADDFPRELRLTPASVLDGTAASVTLDLLQASGNVECFNCSPFRPMSGGSLVLTSAQSTVTLVSLAPSPTQVGVSTLATVAIETMAALGPPTGTVTVLDGSSNALCMITLPATSCTFSPATPGSETVLAQYNGDANYAAAASNSLALTVAPAASGTPAAIPALDQGALAALAILLAAFGGRQTRRR